MSRTNGARKRTNANNVRVRSMDNETLGKFVAEQTIGVFRRVEDLRPFYVELWKRFGQLKKDETISGCHTRTEYCEKILHRTIRSVQHVLRGSRPRKLAQKFAGLPVERYSRGQKGTKQTLCWWADWFQSMFSA